MKKYLKNLLAALLGIKIPRYLVIGNEPHSSAWQWGFLEEGGLRDVYIALGSIDPNKELNIHDQKFAHSSDLLIHFKSSAAVGALIDSLETLRDSFEEEENERIEKTDQK